MADAKHIAELEAALNKARMSAALGQGSGAHRTEVIRQQSNSLLDYLKKSDETNKVMLSTFSGKSKEILNIITSTTQKMVGATSKEARNLSRQLKHLESLTGDLSRKEQKIIQERIKTIRGTAGRASGSAVGNVIRDRLEQFTPINLLKSLPGPGSMIGNFLSDVQSQRQQLAITNLENQLQVSRAGLGGGGGFAESPESASTNMTGSGIVEILEKISSTLDSVGITISDTLENMGLEELTEAGTEKGSIFTHDTHVTDELKESNSLLSKMVKLLTRDKLQAMEDKREGMGAMGAAGKQGMFPFMSDPSSPSSKGIFDGVMSFLQGLMAIPGAGIAATGAAVATAPSLMRRLRNMVTRNRTPSTRGIPRTGRSRIGGAIGTMAKWLGLGGVGYGGIQAINAMTGGGPMGAMYVQASGDAQYFMREYAKFENGEISEAVFANRVMQATGRTPANIMAYDIIPVATANEMAYNLSQGSASAPIYDDAGNVIGMSSTNFGNPESLGYGFPTTGEGLLIPSEMGGAGTEEMAARMVTSRPYTPDNLKFDRNVNRFRNTNTGRFAPKPNGLKWLMKGLKLPYIDALFEAAFVNEDMNAIVARTDLSPQQKKELLGKRVITALGGILGGTTGAGVAASLSGMMALVPGPGWVGAALGLLATGGLWLGGDAAGRWLAGIIGEEVVGNENMAALGEWAYTNIAFGDPSLLNNNSTVPSFANDPNNPQLALNPNTAGFGSPSLSPTPQTDQAFSALNSAVMNRDFSEFMHTPETTAGRQLLEIMRQSMGGDAFMSAEQFGRARMVHGSAGMNMQPVIIDNSQNGQIIQLQPSGGSPNSSSVPGTP
tara:strand:+ start:11056 stop:13563 length:2508 start_codon:yes stop_codon:yes gene_type:complete